MDCIAFDDVTLHVRQDGTPGGPPVVFGNSLGTDMRLWDDVVARLPAGLHMVRYDKRGHGLSTCPPAPYSMGALIRDAERLIEALDLRDVVFVGLSIGGMIAQGLAAKRLDLVRAVVLSNTAPKIGTRALWDERIAQVETEGLSAMSDAIMTRWFSKPFRESDAVSPWRRMVETTPAAGYAGCSAAIAGTDFYTTTAALRLPAQVIAGDADGSTPPDLVQEMAGLIPGARYDLIRGAGHLPCVEKPDEYAAILMRFLGEIGHLPDSAT
ncbi:3-oxoadipate enol-lactonase [Roseibacterium sp. SDUM158016]|uniref:3-oxoadipate enol-lactonase n=1 Tax=Roseicyclus sediminis TaxID=2980997 RepID=UPI0021CF0574|nr:3-oxoadipate enol-lactonase [Roseibacterium sp. SDUM158016]MCU4653325.1 3-oxoadipate enol-lactonase [Roseibacterium sp. SDUM158016]